MNDSSHGESKHTWWPISCYNKEHVNCNVLDVGPELGETSVIDRVKIVLHT